jgi:molybdopterin biosynthesis enzyme
VARIFTGAPIPAGADAVVMQEMAEVQADGQVVFTQPVKWGRTSAALAKISAGRYRAGCRKNADCG